MEKADSSDSANVWTLDTVLWLTTLLRKQRLFMLCAAGFNWKVEEEKERRRKRRGRRRRRRREKQRERLPNREIEEEEEEAEEEEREILTSIGYETSIVGGLPLSEHHGRAYQHRGGRYQNPEEHPFFPDNLPPSLVPPYSYPKFLYPAANSININNDIWDMYFKQLLPLFTVEGDDGNYASTSASDLDCLQALSRRIHYGKFVAEVKFKDAPQNYTPAIRAQDRDALMKLLTFKSVEEMVKRRVEKKAMLFGQEVTVKDDDNNKGKYKVDPAVVSRLYVEWVMPLTKLVEVEYLLRRLD